MDRTRTPIRPSTARLRLAATVTAGLLLVGCSSSTEPADEEQEQEQEQETDEQNTEEGED